MTDPTCVVPTCTQPDRPIHDQAYACPACTRGLARDLRDVAKVAGEAETTIARLDKVNRPARSGAGESDGWVEPPEMCSPDCCPPAGWARLGRHPELRKVDPRGALAPTRQPYRAEVVERYWVAVNEIVNEGRHIVETTGWVWPDPLPAVPGVTCRHYSCGQVRTGRRLGPACEHRQPVPAQHPLAALCEWLAAEKQLDWLRHRQEADEAYVALSAACRVIVRLVDTYPARELVGQCVECGTHLYRIGKAEVVRCHGCGTRYDSKILRDNLLERIGGRLFTAADAAHWVTYLGLEMRRDQVRRRINKWSERGLLVRHEYPGDEPAYRLDDIVARIMDGKASA